MEVKFLNQQEELLEKLIFSTPSNNSAPTPAPATVSQNPVRSRAPMVSAAVPLSASPRSVEGRLQMSSASDQLYAHQPDYSNPSTAAYQRNMPLSSSSNYPLVDASLLATSSLQQLTQQQQQQTPHEAPLFPRTAAAHLMSQQISTLPSSPSPSSSTSAAAWSLRYPTITQQHQYPVTMAGETHFHQQQQQWALTNPEPVPMPAMVFSSSEAASRATQLISKIYGVSS